MGAVSQTIDCAPQRGFGKVLGGGEIYNRSPGKLRNTLQRYCT
jgi:hypothetical protein